MRWQLLIGFVTLLAAPPSLAETFTVHPDGTGDYPTIQAAVDAATHGDTIVLADGTFTGPGNRDVEVTSALSFRSQSGNPATCIIDCEGTPSSYRRGIKMTPSPPVAIPVRFAGITIQRASVDPQTTQIYDGSALTIWHNAAAMTIDYCVFRGNTNAAAVGLLLDDSRERSYITHCVFTGNQGTAGGAVVTFGGDLEIRNCTVAANWAEAGGGFVGSQVDLLLFNTIVWGNCSLYDGFEQIAIDDGDVDFTCCAVDTSGVRGVGMFTIDYLGDNVFVDPSFCDPRPCSENPTIEGDYTLSGSSVCLPGASPCGALIGALGEGCAATPVESSSWGRIKGIYRAP
jgi:hypothetical protein